MAKKKLPLVAICGRPNVGKSTLFNRLTGKSRAIVHDEAGVTRDRYFGESEWNGKRYRLVDTGGMVDRATDAITEKMQAQVLAALGEARAIVFVVDGQAPLTRLDYAVRDQLFKTGKPVVLAANKLDNDRLAERRFDYYDLGLGDPLPVSSGHGLGIADLQDAIAAHLPDAPAAAAEDEAPGEPHEITRVAIIGKPNVGKSSLVNAILNEERVIVDATPGTTREAIDVDFRWKGKEYLFIDTAGLRRKAGIKQAVEHFSVARSLRAMRRADVCLMLVDAVEGISEQDKRIFGYATEQGAGMVLVLTKWDLVEEPEKKFKKIAEDLDYHLPHLKYVPYVTVSNLTRQRVFKVFEYIDRVAAEAGKRIATAELNETFAAIVAANPPHSQRGRQGKIRYVTQASVKPTTFVLFVNAKSLFHFSYLRYIENQLREHYGFEGIPLKLELREGKPRDDR